MKNENKSNNLFTLNTYTFSNKYFNSILAHYQLLETTEAQIYKMLLVLRMCYYHNQMCLEKVHNDRPKASFDVRMVHDAALT